MTSLTKIDVYSFAIIMYELLFEENPYLNETSKKIHHFRPSPSNLKSLNVIFSVAKEGHRPTVPFLNKEELSEWLDEYNVENKQGGNEDMISAVEDYVTLMKRCWEQVPSNRPTFTQIIDTLSKI